MMQKRIHETENCRAKLSAKLRKKNERVNNSRIYDGRQKQIIIILLRVFSFLISGM
jgi:hypothetical protein